MTKIQAIFSKVLIANFTARRVIPLILAFCCFTACLSSVMGWMKLDLLTTVGILVLGLLLMEWAG